MSSNENHLIVAEGLIAYAIASTGMGEDETEFCAGALHITANPEIVRLAASRIHLLAPEPMPADEADGYDRMIRLIGGDPVTKQLGDILRAREWLRTLAKTLDN